MWYSNLQSSNCIILKYTVIKLCNIKTWSQHINCWLGEIYSYDKNLRNQAASGNIIPATAQAKKVCPSEILWKLQDVSEISSWAADVHENESRHTKVKSEKQEENYTKRTKRITNYNNIKQHCYNKSYRSVRNLISHVAVGVKGHMRNVTQRGTWYRNHPIYY